MIDKSGGVKSVCSNVSVACGVKINVPATEGVPEIMPVVGESVRSVGSVPDAMLHVRAPEPPVAVKGRL